MKRFGLLSFLVAAITMFLATIPSAEAQSRKCLVNPYVSCREKCRTQAWMKTPRRCQWLRDIKQGCVAKYDSRFRVCHNRWKANWSNKIRCLSTARNQYNACLRHTGSDAFFRKISNDLRWYCKKQCGKWRWECVRNCTRNIYNYCNKWVTPINRQTSACYVRCKRQFCYIKW